ncbi:hypothetical protein FGRMN_8343 [Fusarium graminum]|nr:hypothetical protein FGRMN_8343 [Fusarium graminum]
MTAASDSEVPNSARREEITGRLADLVSAIESHPQWTPPNVDRGLFHVWDFVKRSHYIMTELDNIEAGRPVQHPDQIPKNNGVKSGPEAAAASFMDVCTRSITINEMIQDPRKMVMLGLSSFDLGTEIKQRSALVKDALFTKE